MNKHRGLWTVIVLLVFNLTSFGQSASVVKMMDVGVAKADITPEVPIRLSGYGARAKSEATAVLHRLNAKAMAFGSDAQRPAILITVDLVGITERITSQLVQRLSEKAGIDPAQVVICASHTHGGPEIGNLINILQYRSRNVYSDSLLALEQLVHIAQYTEMLGERLEQVALAALKNRQPSYVAWGQGQASFAANRRPRGGPVDPALPIIRVTRPDGTLRAVFVNYACHGTTLEGINEINGDWISEAQTIIESKHPGAMALVALGCGADADPRPRGEKEHVKAHGLQVAENVDKLLNAQLQTLNAPPVGRIKWVDLPFSQLPTVAELINTVQTDKTLKGYYARLALERVQRGEKIPEAVRYPVQVWNFDDRLAMVNLAGEVVVDYSLRLKHEFGAGNLWVNAYANDVPCYIASRRVIREGGYETDFSMYCYDKPSPFKEEVEDIIVSAVHELMPPSFLQIKDSVNRQELVRPQQDGTLRLTAVKALSVGPNIKYMPEWEAFGWFNTEDRAEWEVATDRSGRYQVFMKWSVADDAAGKSFVCQVGNKKIRGRIGATGSWFTYATEKIGTVSLGAGVHKLVFMSGNPKGQKGPMLDLAELVLVPVP